MIHNIHMTDIFVFISIERVSLSFKNFVASVTLENKGQWFISHEIHICKVNLTPHDQLLGHVLCRKLK